MKDNAENGSVGSEGVRDRSQDLSDLSLPEMGDRWQHTLGWHPSSAQQVQFQQLYGRILDGNRQFNLTRITEPEEFWEKHLWDSLRGIQSFLDQDPQNQADEDNQSKFLSPFRVIDIGTGAGFPGLPVAIACPDWQITLLDSTRKKVDFLVQLVADLSLPNVATQVDRAEQVGQSLAQRETYHMALIRAVAAAAVCAEYALPLLAIGGVAILYRGHWTAQEAADLDAIAALLGGRVDRVEAFKTPMSGGDRHCIYLRKVAPTPALYPRPVGIPTQSPIRL